MLGLPTPLPIPNLQRLYFMFGDPVDPGSLNVKDPQQVQALYDGVRGSVEQVSAFIHCSWCRRA